MAQNVDDGRVADTTITQIENGSLSAKRSLVHSAAKDCFEPIHDIELVSQFDEPTIVVTSAYDPERTFTWHLSDGIRPAYFLRQL